MYIFKNNVKTLIVAFLLTSLSVSAQTKINGFANSNFSVGKKQSNFFIGQYDNLITSQVTDKVSFLSEVVFEYDEGFVLDVERVIIKYEWDNALNISIGKFHNPIGYWNNAYHHGALLQPTIDRPLAIKFEDEGGILPIHNTGLWISGRDIGKLKFGYDLTVGNGIGSNIYVKDDNNKKSFGAAFNIKPEDNLDIGISGYRDKLVTGEIVQNGDTLNKNLDVNIAAAHLAWMSPKFEIITEYLYLNHKKTGEKATGSHAGFIYAGIPVKKVTPYLRFDMMEYASNDYYYVPDNTKSFTLGLKYEFSYLANIKLELNRTNRKSEGVTNGAVVSCAIGF